MLQNQEQAKRINFDLQFHAEPGGDPGTPPADPGTNPVSISDPVQVVTPTNNDPNPGIPDEIKNNKFFQDAIRGMNEAQRQKAEVLKSLGNVTPDQLPEFLNQINQLNQFQNTVQQIRQTQGDLAARNFIEQQMGFQQIGNQPPEDPYAKYNNIQTLPELVQALTADLKVEARAEAQREFQNYNNTQVLFSQLDTNVQKIIEANPDCGLTAEQIKQAVYNGGYRPEKAIYGFIDAMGGQEKYEEYLSGRAVSRYTEKIKNNNQNTSTTLTSGVPVSTPNQLPNNMKGLKNLVAEQFAAQFNQLRNK